MNKFLANVHIHVLYSATTVQEQSVGSWTSLGAQKSRRSLIGPSWAGAKQSARGAGHLTLRQRRWTKKQWATALKTYRRSKFNMRLRRRWWRRIVMISRNFLSISFLTYQAYKCIGILLFHQYRFLGFGKDLFHIRWCWFRIVGPWILLDNHTDMILVRWHKYRRARKVILTSN